MFQIVSICFYIVFTCLWISFPTQLFISFFHSRDGFCSVCFGYFILPFSTYCFCPRWLRLWVYPTVFEQRSLQLVSTLPHRSVKLGSWGWYVSGSEQEDWHWPWKRLSGAKPSRSHRKVAANRVDIALPRWLITINIAKHQPLLTISNQHKRLVVWQTTFNLLSIHLGTHWKIGRRLIEPQMRASFWAWAGNQL